MFSIKQATENGFHKIILQDDERKTYASIVPACGAILLEFSVQHQNAALNIIDSYESAEDFKKNITAKGFKGTKLAPFACRMNQGEYSFAQQHYKIEKFYLGKNAIHGLIYDAAFIVTDTHANETGASITMKHSYRSNDKGYPFNFDCVVNYLLEKENKLSVTTKIVNESNGLIPVQDGWHPYFKFGGGVDELQLEFQSKAMVEFDAELIPTGKLIPYDTFDALKKIGNTLWDNCFVLDFTTCQPLVVLRDPKQNIQLEIFPDASYPYLQIYTPDHRKSIAIENLSAAPDAFNNDMGKRVLAIGDEAVFKTVYKIKML